MLLPRILARVTDLTHLGFVVEVWSGAVKETIASERRTGGPSAAELSLLSSIVSFLGDDLGKLIRLNELENRVLEQVIKVVSGFGENDPDRMEADNAGLKEALDALHSFIFDLACANLVEEMGCITKKKNPD